MLQAQLTQGSSLSQLRSLGACNATEDDNIQETIAHQAIGAVNTAHCLAGYEKAGNFGFCVLVD